MTVWWLTLFLVQDARGQVPNAQAQAEKVRAAMAASLEQQRQSVQRQEQSIHASPQYQATMHSQEAPDSWVRLKPPADADCDPISSPQLARMIDDAAQKHGIDAAVVREVARQESGFYPCAISPKGAVGVMQLMPATQSWLQVRNPFDPQESIEAGSKLLKDLLDRYHGDLSLALSAYNAGAGAVDRVGGIPQIPETQNYVTDVLMRLSQ